MSKRTEWCKHYNGLTNECCNAGIKYDSVAVLHELPKGGSVPCIPNWNRDGEAKCGKFELRTPEEIAAYEQAMAKRFVHTGMARLAIVDHLGLPWRHGTPGASGSIGCPCCGGKGSLAFSRSGYNGHINARCSTAGCVSWME